jgi:hypothetical protein
MTLSNQSYFPGFCLSPESNLIYRSCQRNRGLSCTLTFLHCRGLSCNWGYLYKRSLSCHRTCLHYTSQDPWPVLDVSTLKGPELHLFCSWTCLHHRGLSCTWTCPHCRGLSFNWVCLVYGQKKPELTLDVSSPQDQEPWLLLDVSKLKGPELHLFCSWTCLHYRRLCCI